MGLIKESKLTQTQIRRGPKMRGGLTTFFATTPTRDTSSDDAFCQGIARILSGCPLAMRNNKKNKREFVFCLNRPRNFRKIERLTNSLHGTFVKSAHRGMKNLLFHRSF